MFFQSFNMAMSAKKLSEAGVCKVYKQAFKEQFRWDEILPDSIFKFLDVLAKARACPVTLAMGSLLPLTLCLMGPKARICVSGAEHLCDVSVGAWWWEIFNIWEHYKPGCRTCYSQLWYKCGIRAIHDGGHSETPGRQQRLRVDREWRRSQIAIGNKCQTKQTWRGKGAAIEDVGREGSLHYSEW